MLTLPTPEPISLRINIPVGDVVINAGQRSDTVVTLHRARREIADDGYDLKITYERGRLTIDGPEPTAVRSDWFDPGETIDLHIGVPEGSSVRCTAGLGGMRTEGRLGECTFRADSGEVWLDETGPLSVRTISGDVSVNRVVGHLEVTSQSGEVSAQEIQGTALITTTDGESRIGDVTGDIRVNGRNADITVSRAQSSVDAHTLWGDIRIGEVVRGLTRVASVSGGIEVGVRENAAALIYLESSAGRTCAATHYSDTTFEADRFVEIQARSVDGDIYVDRYRPKAG